MTSNPNSPDFDYKKYSLEKLQEWVHDALSCGEASPHEIYSAIREAVREDYYYYKDHCSRAFGLLERLSGHRPVADKSEYTTTGEKVPLSCDKDDKSPECQSAWNDFWEENYYPKEHKGSTVSSVSEKKSITQLTYEDAIKNGWEMTSDGFWIPPQNKKKWILPVEVVRDEDTDKDEYCVSFPDDLLEATNLKEGDEVEWIDLKNGSYELRKVTRPLQMDEC